MINQNDRERLVVHLNSLINSVFKVLPLYEEENEGLKKYIESLLLELYGLQNVIEIQHSHEYLTLLSTLESLKEEINDKNNKQPTIKREVFKCINIINSMIEKIQEELKEDGG